MNHQVWVTGPGSVEVRDVGVPDPGAGEVLVATAYAGLCGSDLHTVRRGHPWLPYPVAPGHEGSARVERVGPGVGGLAEGDLVYVRPAVADGTCFMCRRGRPNLCEHLIGVGSHVPGLFAERVALPAAALAPLPSGIDLVAGALLEPFATALHAVGRAGAVAGATAAVIGGGSIGLSVLLALRASGAGPVVVVDPVASKRDLARELGAAAAAAPGEPVTGPLGGRPDVVLDCVASPATVRAAVDLAVRGGDVVVVGAGHGPVELPIETLQDSEVRVGGSAMYVPADFERAEQLVAGGVPVHRLVTRRLPVAEAVLAYERAAAGDDVKVHLVGPGGDHGAV